MFHDIIFLLLGLALIIAGGNILTDGAVAIAKKFKISPLVIGLTIVAFGSSTPDFVISFISTLTGKSELALGDIVGANIFDLLLVVGIVALISPINVAGDMARKDIPMLFLSSTALFLCAADKLVDHLPANIVDRTDGLLLLVFFAFFMQFTFSMAHSRSISPSSTAMTSPATYAGRPTSMPATTPGFPDNPKYAMWIAAIYVAGGLAALVFGGQWLVDGASGIAIKIGISEALVGLTIVGIGSSIPDLATSVIAAMKKQPGIALGNAIGACIFNVFFIIGVCATVKPLHAGNVTSIDFGTLVFASLLLLIFGSMSRRHTIKRVEGMVLVACYIAYFVYLIVDA